MIFRVVESPTMNYVNGETQCQALGGGACGSLLSPKYVPDLMRYFDLPSAQYRIMGQARSAKISRSKNAGI